MAVESDTIVWLAHPFYHVTEHLRKDDPRRNGHFEVTPYVRQMLNTPIVLPTVEPSGEVLAILKRHYPKVDPAKPPWRAIEARLLAAGVPLKTVHNANSLKLVRMLDEVKPQRTPDEKTDKKTDNGGKNEASHEVNNCARYIREQRTLIQQGKRPKANKKALIAEHLGHPNTGAMERELQPSRYGWLLDIGKK